MLHYLITYVLMLKQSNHSQIGDLELQLIYAIKNKIQVNWAYTIMYHMRHQNSLIGGLPYARLITKILEGWGIDLKWDNGGNTFFLPLRFDRNLLRKFIFPSRDWSCFLVVRGFVLSIAFVLFRSISMSFLWTTKPKKSPALTQKRTL